VKTKKLAGAAAVGTVTAVTTLLLGATPALAQDDSTSDSAFALELSGLVDVNPISVVESVDGKLVHDELLSIGDVAGALEDDISFGLLTSEAEANRAETAVKEVNILDILRADVIRTWCDNGEGGLQVVNGTILGNKIPDTSVPSEELDVSPLVKLSLNDQKRHTDGALSVTGIELTVLPSGAADMEEELTADEQAALPVLGGLLGTSLDSNASTIGDVVGQLGGVAALGGLQQTITIGSVTCQEGGAASGASDSAGDDGDSNGSDDGASDDGDSNGGSGDDDGDDDGGDASGNGDNSDVKAATAPSAVQAALPVTG
jgi:hypothetical protein